MEAKARTMIDPATPPVQLSDHELVEDYEKSSGEPGDPVADNLLAEIQHRELDV